MKITGVETLWFDGFPDLSYVRIHTDEGIVGLGETCFGPAAVEAYIHESVAQRLLGKDPLEIERHARDLSLYYIGHGGTGVSTRAHSAIDLALWDILGKVSAQPIYQLLGGRCRERVRIYNTCAGYRYGRKETAQREGRPAPEASPTDEGLLGAAPRGPYEDLVAFQTAADELAVSLLDQGVTALKMWPFDEVAHANSGQFITASELRTCLEPIEKIRNAVGRSMDVMIELHGLWQPLPAAQICRALESFEPFWVEDAIKLQNLDVVARLAESTRLPLTFGETVGNRYDMKRLLDTGAVGIVMFDFGWGGGITEAKRYAALSEAYNLPLSPHDCTGPVALTAGIHLSVSTPNVLIQETVRAFYTDWYTQLVTELPTISDGHAAPLDAPGFGLELLPGLENRPDAHVRITS